jgi:hydrogenase maturation protease
VDFLALGGISLMERLIGYDQAVLIDAIVTNQHPIGTVYCFDITDLPARDLGHMGSPHDTTLMDALKLGQRMGIQLPDKINIIAVESQNVFDFCEELTPSVEAAIPEAVQLATHLFNISNTPEIQESWKV